MSRFGIRISAILVVALVTGGAYVLAGDNKPAAADAKSSSASSSCDSTLNCEGCAPLDAKEIDAKLSKLKALEGTWIGTPSAEAKAKGMGETKITFHAVANGTAVVESMFPGTAYEMVNVYHPTADGVMVTHYCAMGVQPRMKLASSTDKSMKFVFVDCTNLKSRDEGHMDSLELTIDGEKLTEDWAYFKDGKTTENTKFELKKQPQQGQTNAG